MAIDLNKRIEKVKIILAKKNLPDVVAQVGVAFDISGSMQSLYGNGTVQDVAERILAIACRFDDNQNLDAWTFTGGCDTLESITLENYATFVKKEILENGNVSKWGSTSYSPVMQSILNEYFPTSVVKTVKNKLFGLFSDTTSETVSTPKTTDPSYVIVITDGENDDVAKTISLIESTADKNIYWQFVGIGSTKFAFLEKIAGRYSNVGFVAVADLSTTSDDDLYLKLLDDKFCGWVKK